MFIKSWGVSHVTRKLDLGVCDQARLKPACSATETSESWNFRYSKYRHNSSLTVYNKGADQTAQMCRLISAFVVRIWHKQVFSWCGTIVKVELTRCRVSLTADKNVDCNGFSGLNTWYGTIRLLIILGRGQSGFDCNAKMKPSGKDWNAVHQIRLKNNYLCFW